MPVLFVVLGWSGKRCTVLSDISQEVKSGLVVLAMILSLGSVPSAGYYLSWAVELPDCTVQGEKDKVVGVLIVAGV